MAGVRLNAYLARAGVASRRKADDLIKAGRVRVNGDVGALNTFVGDRDTVEVDGKRISGQRLTYVLLHKPAGVVTTARDPYGRPTVVALVPSDIRIVPVGRLDADTPARSCSPTTASWPTGLPIPATASTRSTTSTSRASHRTRPFTSSPTASSSTTGCLAPATATRKGRSRIELTLHEGRTHQVKRMCETVGHPVVRLHRSCYAGLGLRGLASGDWRHLTDEEVSSLRRLVGL